MTINHNVDFPPQMKQASESFEFWFFAICYGTEQTNHLKENFGSVCDLDVKINYF